MIPILNNVAFLAFCARAKRHKMMKSTFKALGASVLALSLALCGCGDKKSGSDSGSKSDGGSSGTPTRAAFKPMVGKDVKYALGVNLDKEQTFKIVDACIDELVKVFKEEMANSPVFDEEDEAGLKKTVAEIREQVAACKEDPFKNAPKDLRALLDESGLRNPEIYWGVLALEDFKVLDKQPQFKGLSLSIAMKVDLEKLVSALQWKFGDAWDFEKTMLEGERAWHVVSSDFSFARDLRKAQIDPYVTSLDGQLVLVASSPEALAKQIRLYRKGEGKGGLLDGFSAADGEFAHLHLSGVGDMLWQYAPPRMMRDLAPELEDGKEILLGLKDLVLDVKARSDGSLWGSIQLGTASSKDADQLRSFAKKMLPLAATGPKVPTCMKKMIEEVKIGGELDRFEISDVNLFSLTLGGLWWHVSSLKSAAEQMAAQVIQEKQKAARQSIEKTVSVIKDEYTEFHERVLKGDKAVQDAVREVKKALPDELQAAAARVFDRSSVLPAAEPPAEMPVAEERLAENAVPPLQLPRAVKKYEKIWEDVCQYRAADSRLHEEVQKLLKKAEKADELTTQDEETANKLATLANELVEAYNRLKGEKWLVEAKRKVHGIEAGARRYGKDAVEKIKLAVERHQRELEERRAAEEKAAAAAVAAQKLKETIEEEQKTAEEEFANLEDAIKHIDWSCTNSLVRLQAKMTTREGKDAVNDQIRKIDVMAGMQRHFIKHADKFVFKDRRGQVLAIVMKVDDKTLTIQKAKYEKGKPVPDKETRVAWDRFYGLKEKIYLNYMNQFINELVMKGRERTKIGPKEWSEHMLGAALTLQYLYGDQKGVDKFVPELVQKAVKGFEPCRVWAVKWFPDVKLEDPDE